MLSEDHLIMAAIRRDLFLVHALHRSMYSLHLFAASDRSAHRHQKIELLTDAYKGRYQDTGI